MTEIIGSGPLAYYNEIDPKAAAWLRELVSRGLIARGIVDERDIRDVVPGELSRFTQCHFFAGIGVWSHALRLAGWPDDRPVWTGSCPCQPFSAAGKRGGSSDERHLWPHWFHLIEQCRPPVVFGEQVASKDGLGWLDLVHSDLEGSGYSVGAADLCAAGVGSPHIRQRLWFVGRSLADPGGEGPQGGEQPRERAEPQQSPAQRSGDAFCVGDADSHGAGRFGGGVCREVDREDGQHEADDALASGGTLLLADAQGGEQRGLRERREGERRGQLPAGGHGAAFVVEHAEGDGRQQRRTEPVGRVSAARRGDGGVADPDGGEHGQQQEDRGACVVADAEGDGGRADPGSVRGGTYARVRKEEGENERRSKQQDGRAFDSGSACESTGPTNGFWGDADWLLCRDGKWRAVEPGTFPLAHGSPARVGRLRGYGNAIVAQVAAEFISAYTECEIRERD